jgi:uridine kinase
VRAQYFGQVKPMHDRYVEPSRAFANEIINSERDFSKDVERVALRIIGYNANGM